ncbi:hypothetical protein B0H21DRAFT_34152 [Amylocystis lapponica]|nr:hypothetical protein B0H21DRAFT_34152 [Amylocystis lapponica]
MGHVFRCARATTRSVLNCATNYQVVMLIPITRHVSLLVDHCGLPPSSRSMRTLTVTSRDPRYCALQAQSRPCTLAASDRPHVQSSPLRSPRRVDGYGARGGRRGHRHHAICEWASRAASLHLDKSAGTEEPVRLRCRTGQGMPPMCRMAMWVLMGPWQGGRASRLCVVRSPLTGACRSSSARCTGARWARGWRSCPLGLCACPEGMARSRKWART